jgi:dolichol-phosphate mannosyltransferase
VDDGSTDGTAEELESMFADRWDSRIIRHAQNQGVAAATLSGIREANSELVCAIDADCTYDPQQLQAFIPLMTDSVDVVTASPYHPLGGVMNVPRWRLFLSRSASRLYRLMLRNKLYTYTSCFRVYRKSAVEGIQVRDGRFLGITEILWQLDRRGSQIVECPAVLEVRVLGTSKLRALRGIASHLKLLTHIARQRFLPGVKNQPPVSNNTMTPHEVLHVDTHDHSLPPHAAV